MAIKCKNCGGNTFYNINTGLLHCSHCGEKCKVEDNVTTSYSECIEHDYNQDEISTSLFQCPECGAEVRSFQEEMTIHCPYCGKQAFLKRTESSIKPKYIVPFKIDKKNMKQYYQNYIAKQRFVPPEFKNDDAIENFKGIYIPHWSLTYEASTDFEFTAWKTYVQNGYKHNDLYELHVTIDGPIDNVTFDASYLFNDTIAQKIAPFYTRSKKPFSEGYVAGFYCDKETIDSDTYAELAQKNITNKITKEIMDKEKSYTSIHPQSKENKKILKKTQANLIMLPVWFMTHRNKDRVSYGVINGQTGNMTMDLPVDKKAFFKFAGMLSIMLSVIFLLPTSTIPFLIFPKVVSFIFLLILLLSNLVLYEETKVIYQKTHNPQTHTPPTHNGKTKKPLLLLISLILVCLLVFAFKILSFDFTSTSNLGIISTIPLLIGQIVLKIKTSSIAIKHEKKCTLFSLLITILGTIIMPLSFMSGWVYYGLACMCFVGVFINVLNCIYNFNYLTTLPVPNFFNRGEI